MTTSTTYMPAHFEQRDLPTLHAHIEANPLATWVTTHDGDLVVHHVPFLLDRTRGPFGTLVGHVARANPVWRAPQPSLLVFGGPQAYVSPGWQPSKHVHGKVVPTWNYAVVHVRGTPVVLEDAASLRCIVSQLTDAHEASQARPWRVDDAPPDFVEQMLQAVVGIELPIEQLVGKWKLSQNRSAEDRAGIAAGLRAQDPANRMAAWVEPATPD